MQNDDASQPIVLICKEPFVISSDVERARSELLEQQWIESNTPHYVFKFTDLNG